MVSIGYDGAPTWRRLRMTTRSADALPFSGPTSFNPRGPAFCARVCITVLVCLAGSFMLTGCRAMSLDGFGGWVADYDTAEDQVHKTGRELLIAYLDPRPRRTGASMDVLDDTVIRARTTDYVCCRLYKSYEPDRRYVAQYGVERSPAMIIVHGDGTYHALEGSMSAERVSRFLDEAVGRGADPTVNHQIPRQARYRWHDNVRSAEEESKGLEKAVLFVFHRRFSRDWQRLEEILSRREVYRRFSDMVDCRIDTLNPWSKVHVTQFGPVRLPAIVIADGDGTYDVLEMPTSYEAVVQFANRNLGSFAPTDVSSTAAVAGP